MVEPSKLPSIFCYDGEEGIDRNDIPSVKVSTGSACWKDGFPVETQKPLDAGGIAPRRQDFNELFYLLSQSLKYIQNGGLWSYSEALDYKPLDIVTSNGAIYECIAANGVSTSVRKPTEDTFEQYWSKLFDSTGRNSLVQKAYPVGSIYITTANGNPSSILGFGTWRKLQGRFLLGSSNTYANGSTGGTEKNTLITANLPSHSHAVTLKNAGTHSHTGSSGSAGSHAHTASVESNGSHTHTGSTNSTGTHTHTRGTMEITGTFSPAYEDRVPVSPTGAFYYSGDTGEAEGFGYKTKKGYGFQASRSWVGNTSNAGSHSHTVSTDPSGSHGHTVTIGNSGTHNHTVTVSNSGDHNHAITVGNTGSGQAFNNMPPYLVVNMWERTA